MSEGLRQESVSRHGTLPGESYTAVETVGKAAQLFMPWGLLVGEVVVYVQAYT